MNIKSIHFIFGLFFIIIITSSVSCQNAQRRQQLDSNCNASFGQYERRKVPERLKQESKSLAGNITSYTVGAGIILTETLVYVGGGVIIGALICSPILVAEVASESKSDAGIECVIKVGGKAASLIIQKNKYSLSKKFWKSTESIRVKSYDALVVHLLDSVECRMDSGKSQDLKIAQKQLQALKKDKKTVAHLEEFTRRRIRNLSKDLHKMISKTTP